MFELGEDLVTTQGIVETGVAFPPDPPARWLARRPPGYSASRLGNSLTIKSSTFSEIPPTVGSARVRK